MMCAGYGAVQKVKLNRRQAMTDKVKIKFYDVDINTDAHTDCGGVAFAWRCPDCGERIVWAPYRWWDMKCCRDWEFDVKITGTNLIKTLDK